MQRNPESFQGETDWWIKEDAPLLNMNTDSSLHSICLHLVPEWIIHLYNLLTGTFKWWMTRIEPLAAAKSSVVERNKEAAK